MYSGKGATSRRWSLHRTPNWRGPCPQKRQQGTWPSFSLSLLHAVQTATGTLESNDPRTLVARGGAEPTSFAR